LRPVVCRRGPAASGRTRSGSTGNPLARGLGEIASKHLDDESPAHSFRTLLNELATLVRNTCRRKAADAKEAIFHLDTLPNAKQQEALRLIEAIRL